MVCVVCSCATSSYREVCRVKGGIGNGETLCHDIYPAWPITTVSLATNTYCAVVTLRDSGAVYKCTDYYHYYYYYCMMDGHSSCAPRTVDPRVNFAVRVNKAIDNWPGIQKEAICYQWFKQ